MRRLRSLLPAFAAAATAAAAAISPTSATAATRPCPGAHLTPSAAHATQVRAATICLVNRQRVRHGLRRLRAHRSLNHAASSYARLMVAQRFTGEVASLTGDVEVVVLPPPAPSTSSRWTSDTPSA